MDTESLDCIVKFALSEDLSPSFGKGYKNLLQGEKVGQGDVTTEALFEDQEADADVIAKSKGVLSGSQPFIHVFKLIDPEIVVNFLKKDGEQFNKGDRIVHLHGKVRSILMGERTALNFIGHLSGVATEVKKLVSLLKGTTIKVLDTRKTLPGLRALEKEAVLHGGGMNHRMGLYDMVLLKDNHIDAAGSIKDSIKRVRSLYGERFKIEVETRNLEEVEQALFAGADRIMLDNMTKSMIKKAARLIGEKAEIEVSGNLTRKSIRHLKGIGVDFISAGYITYAPGHADFSLKLGK
ncbi:MAG: carboxylating nicotinate-nucleotide diphosphorylase [Spirochaetota bacterium]|nr:MAG: carboxylating nicotinate-nucleotide diphosphorylase [Spirochaetota bacterium]